MTATARNARLDDEYEVVLVRIDRTGRLWDTYGPLAAAEWREVQQQLQERSPDGMTVDATFLRPLAEVGLGGAS